MSIDIPENNRRIFLAKMFTKVVLILSSIEYPVSSIYDQPHML